MKNRCVKFKDGLLFRRVNLIDGFAGSIVMRQKKEPLTINVNKDAYMILDLLDHGCSLEECVENIGKQTGERVEDIRDNIFGFVNKLIDNGVAGFVEGEICRENSTQVRKAITLDSYYTLESVAIELLEKCNLKCKHCYGAFDVDKVRILPKETVFDVLDQLSDLHCKEVSFTGGEVLLHEDFMDIMKYAVKKPFCVSFLTNGTLITEDIVSELKKLGPMDIQISLDGHESDVHDDLRGVAGAFGRTVKGVEMLRDAGFDITVSHVVNGNNRKQFKQMEAFIQNMEVEFKYGAMLRLGKAEVCDRNYNITPEEYYRTLKPFANNSDDRIVKEIDTGYIERCSAGEERIAIKSNGNIVPCEIIPDDRKFCMGNIYSNRIKEVVLDYNRTEALGSMNAIELDECRECKSIWECKGGCVAGAIAEYGITEVPDPFTCARMKALCNESYKEIVR